MQDLSSLTRAPTCGTPAVETLSPNHWTARGFPSCCFFDCLPRLSYTDLIAHVRHTWPQMLCPYCVEHSFCWCLEAFITSPFSCSKAAFTVRPFLTILFHNHTCAQHLCQLSLLVYPFHLLVIHLVFHLSSTSVMKASCMFSSLLQLWCLESVMK